MLSARVAELIQYMDAPTLGRLTDEQRAISLAVVRRLAASVARRIDPQMDVDALWQSWLQDGIPTTAELALACFARTEEYRWQSVSLPEVNQQSGTLGEATSPFFGDEAQLADAYLHLQVADRRRYDISGYPALAIADISDDLYRHMLNEVGRWRLKQISRDRSSSMGLGEAVRNAWSRRAEEQSMIEAARGYYDLLVVHHRLYDEANDAISRGDWPAFIGLAAVAQGRDYADMALHLLSAPSAILYQSLQPLHLRPEILALLEASLESLPARFVRADASR